MTVEWLSEISAIPRWQLVLVAVVLLILFSIEYRVLTKMLLERTDREVIVIVLEELYIPIVTLAMVTAVLLGSILIEEADLRFVLQAVTLTLLVILWSYALIRIGNRLVRIPDRQKLKFGPVFANIFTVLVLIAAVFVILDIWGVDVTPLLASAGIIGIVLGFAARDTISNLAAGVSLYFDRTFVVGDFITLPSGERGTVVDISIRSTTILTRDNVTVTVPNAEFNRDQVVNESAPQRHRRLRIDVSVAYGSDLEEVDHAMMTAAAEVDYVIEEPTPVVRFREFGDSGIRAQLQCHISHPANRGSAVDELIRQINHQFSERDIKIPFPQRELTFFESGNTIHVEGDRHDETHSSQ